MLDVYVGFMDEEVSDVLAHIIDHAIDRKRPVLVIERGRIGGTIFERHIRSYGTDRGWFLINHVFGGSVAGHEDALLRALSRSIDEQFSARFLDSLKPKYDQSTKSKTSKLVLSRTGRPADDSPLFSVLRFTPESRESASPASQDPVVVVRSPEMGLQPDLTGTFLRAVFRALLTRPGASKEYRVSVYGAGGAIGEHDAPGQLHEISGSVYVGSEIVERSADPEKAPDFRGVVSFVGYKDNGAAGGRSFKSASFYESAVYSGADAREKAEAHARAAFAYLCGDPGQVEKWQAESKHLDDVDQIKASIGARNHGDLRNEIHDACSKKVSLTASFFVGKALKVLARTLDLHDTNMEDYHVLNVLKGLQTDSAAFGDATLRAAKVVRVDCDPPEIPDEVESSFESWTRNTKYSRQHYLSALRWGLFGAQVSHLGEAAQSRRDRPYHWNWVDQESIGGRWRTLFYPPKGAAPERGYVLDPFFVEMATDFLVYVKEGRVYGRSGRKEYELTSAARRKLETRAKWILLTFAKLQSGRPAGFLNGELEDLLTTLFSNESYVTGRCPLVHSTDGYEIWARPESWDRNQSVLAAELKVSGAIVDRALYKSSNQVALQDHAKRQLMPDES